MTKAADYIVVVSNDDDFQDGYHHFSEKVNRKLRAGYQLHGQPFVIERVMCQTMIKPPESTMQNGHAMPESIGDTTSFYQHTANL